MAGTVSRRAFLGGVAGACALAACDAGTSREDAESRAGGRVESIIASMPIEEKVAQLIVVSMRAWEEEDVCDLAKAPELARTLRRHQYGGAILFSSNVRDSEQTLRLVCDLQANNALGAEESGAEAIPYFVAADQEGGSVARLTMGTRGTGSMAIGATGADAARNAYDTGAVFGSELAALGINLNLAPCADVVWGLADPGLSTRSFSDLPDVCADCALEFSHAVGECGVISCVKHFPGAGDGSDLPTAIPLTLDQLRGLGLAAFAAIVEDGAEMVMASSCTFPEVDAAVTLADGRTMGHYPATMSGEIVEGLLRGELGFDGVVMTDALEMDQFFVEPDTGAEICPGGRDVEGCVNVALRCIAAGCDILLMPKDLTGPDAVTFLEGLVSRIAARVEAGDVTEDRIDQSLRRILGLKEARGLLDPSVAGRPDDAAVARAASTVGSLEHHATERAIAERAVTLLKDDGVLPVPGTGASVVILGRTASDATPIGAALAGLMEAGDLDAGVAIENAITGARSGAEGATSRIYVDRYFDFEEGLVWSDGLSRAIASADYVVCLAATWAGLDLVQDGDGRMQGITRALGLAHEAGARFVLLSDNLPVDAARFSEADAIVCCYLSSGFDVDPRQDPHSKTMGAYNANVPAALAAIFGAADMPGTLPIDLYAMERAEDGTWAYTDEVLYPRGCGLARPS